MKDKNKIYERLKEIYTMFRVIIPIEPSDPPTDEELDFLVEYICEKRNKRPLKIHIEDEMDVDYLEVYLQ